MDDELNWGLKKRDLPRNWECEFLGLRVLKVVPFCPNPTLLAAIAAIFKEQLQRGYFHFAMVNIRVTKCSK